MTKILIGFMGAGKSTIAKALDPNYIDLDQAIVSYLKMPISQYFEEYGEEAFRLVESQMLQEHLGGTRVLSTGGGIVESERNRQLLSQESQVIYLRAPFEELYQRVLSDGQNHRPLIQGSHKDQVKAIYDRRLALYEEVADQIIDVAGRSVEDIVKELK